MSVMTSEEHGNNYALIVLVIVAFCYLAWVLFSSVTNGGEGCTVGETRVVDGEVQVCKAPTYWVEEGDGR